MHLHQKRHELKNSDIFMSKVIAAGYATAAVWHWSCNIMIIRQPKPIKNKRNFCRVTVSKSQKLSLQLMLSSYHIPHYSVVDRTGQELRC